MQTFIYPYLSYNTHQDSQGSRSSRGCTLDITCRQSLACRGTARPQPRSGIPWCRWGSTRSLYTAGSRSSRSCKWCNLVMSTRPCTRTCHYPPHSSQCIYGPRTGKLITNMLYSTNLSVQGFKGNYGVAKIIAHCKDSLKLFPLHQPLYTSRLALALLYITLSPPQSMFHFPRINVFSFPKKY